MPVTSTEKGPARNTQRVLWRVDDVGLDAAREQLDVGPHRRPADPSMRPVEPGRNVAVDPSEKRKGSSLSPAVTAVFGVTAAGARVGGQLGSRG